MLGEPQQVMPGCLSKLHTHNPPQQTHRHTDTQTHSFHTCSFLTALECLSYNCSSDPRTPLLSFQFWKFPPLCSHSTCIQTSPMERLRATRKASCLLSLHSCSLSDHWLRALSYFSYPSLLLWWHTSCLLKYCFSLLGLFQRRQL